MSKKYNIISTYSLLPLTVKFREEEGEDLTINVRVDYNNDKVYFEGDTQGLDLVSLEKEILEIFKPPEVEIPDFYYEHLDKIKEVSQADFASSFLDTYHLRSNGRNDDSRQS